MKLHNKQVLTITICRQHIGVGGGVAGVQAHPQNFDLAKIREKSVETFAKSLKI